MPQSLYFGAPAHLRQVRCDQIQAAFRSEQSVDGSEPKRASIRRDPPRREAPLDTTEILPLRLAEEIDYARRILEGMGNELSNDPTVVARHMVALQSVDVIGQLLGHIANVVRSSDPRASVEQIGMTELRGRLKRLSIA